VRIRYRVFAQWLITAAVFGAVAWIAFHLR
jgi:hypothetical protein